MDFGFAPIKTRAINFDQNDDKILNYVLQLEPSFNVCLSCGSCTATCVAGSLTNFNIRKMNTLLRRGEPEGLEIEVNKCMLCGKCHLVCPRGINTRNVIMLIKKAISEMKTTENFAKVK